DGPLGRDDDDDLRDRVGAAVLRRVRADRSIAAAGDLVQHGPSERSEERDPHRRPGQWAGPLQAPRHAARPDDDRRPDHRHRLALSPARPADGLLFIAALVGLTLAVATSVVISATERPEVEDEPLPAMAGRHAIVR